MIFCSFVTMIKKQGTILIVDDNRNILTTVRMLLDSIFANIITIANPNSIPAKLREEHPDVVLLDMNFSSGINSGNEGLYWLREIKSLSPKTEVVLFTAYADIQLAVTGIKEGAADFIVKPFDNEKMISTLLEARDRNKAADKAMVKHSGKDSNSTMYWGDSEVMNNLRNIVEKVAATDANILITGENGTGKEVLANEIHRLSARSEKRCCQWIWELLQKHCSKANSSVMLREHSRMPRWTNRASLSWLMVAQYFWTR